MAAGGVLCFSGTLAAWAQTTAQPADSYEKAEAAFHEKDYARAADLGPGPAESAARMGSN